MRHITISSLYLGLNDLLTKRQAALQSSASGAASVKILSLLRDGISALPATLTGRPLADALDTTDTRHDGLGAAIWHVLEGYLRHPETSPAMIEAALKIRAAFVPSLDGLQVSYVEEAKAAMDRKPDLTKLQNELSMFPVPGGSLHHWAVSFLAAGEKLDTLLSERADVKDRKEATRLRAEALGTLNRLHKNLVQEMRRDASLPKDLDEQVFGYFDLLEAQAAEAYDAAKKKEQAPKKAAKEAPKEAQDQAPPAPAPAAPEAPAGGEGKDL